MASDLHGFYRSAENGGRALHSCYFSVRALSAEPGVVYTPPDASNVAFLVLQIVTPGKLLVKPALQLAAGFLAD